MRRLLAVTLAALLALLALPAAAQENDETFALEVLEVITDDYPEVEVVVSTPPELFAAELDEDMVTVRENGVERTARIVSRPSEDLSIVLVLDTSGSMTPVMDDAIAGAVSFVEQMPAGIRLAVVNFADQTTVVVEPTVDHAAVIAGLESLQAGGNTAFYEGIVTSLDLLAEEDEGALVLFSDSDDNPHPDRIEQSPPLEEELDSLLEIIAESEVPFYAVELITVWTVDGLLDQLAEAGGGTVVSAEDPGALTALYGEIAGLLTRSFVLRYEAETGGATDIEAEVNTEFGRAVGGTRTILPTLPTPTPEPEPEPTPEPIPTEEPGIAPAAIDPGIYGSPWALVVGAALFYVAIALAVLIMLSPRPRVVRLSERGGWFHRPRLAELAERATLVADKIMRRTGRQRRVNMALERAGVNLRAGEFAVLVASIGTVAAVIGWLLWNVWIAAALAIGTVVISRLVLSVLASRRQRLFADQIPDTLQMLAGSLRAGYGMVQALDTIGREAPAPTSQEFRRVVVETRLGRSTIEALRAMAERMDSEDFDWVVQAMEIHAEIGGDLAEILDNVAGTVRDRNHVRGQVKALSAEGRLSAIILVVLPFVMAFFVSLLNPGYINELFDSTVGMIMTGVAVLLMAIGAVWLRRIVRLVY